MEYTIQTLDDLEDLVSKDLLTSKDLLLIFEKALRIRYLTEERRNLAPRPLFSLLRSDYERTLAQGGPPVHQGGPLPIWLDVVLKIEK
jgi:hypothetical protein